MKTLGEACSQWKRQPRVLCLVTLGDLGCPGHQFPCLFLEVVGVHDQNLSRFHLVIDNSALKTPSAAASQSQLHVRIKLGPFKYPNAQGASGPIQSRSLRVIPTCCQDRGPPSCGGPGTFLCHPWEDGEGSKELCNLSLHFLENSSGQI